MISKKTKKMLKRREEKIAASEAYEKEQRRLLEKHLSATLAKLPEEKKEDHIGSALDALKEAVGNLYGHTHYSEVMRQWAIVEAMYRFFTDGTSWPVKESRLESFSAWFADHLKSRQVPAYIRQNRRGLFSLVELLFPGYNCARIAGPWIRFMATMPLLGPLLLDLVGREEYFHSRVGGKCDLDNYAPGLTVTFPVEEGGFIEREPTHVKFCTLSWSPDTASPVVSILFKGRPVREIDYYNSTTKWTPERSAEIIPSLIVATDGLLLHHMIMCGLNVREYVEHDIVKNWCEDQSKAQEKAEKEKKSGKKKKPGKKKQR